MIIKQNDCFSRSKFIRQRIIWRRFILLLYL